MQEIFFLWIENYALLWKNMEGTFVHIFQKVNHKFSISLNVNYKFSISLFKLISLLVYLN